MRKIHIFSLITIIITAVLTYGSIASAATVHVLENLDSKESKLVRDLMKEKGYIVSNKPMFSVSNETVVITKTVSNNVDEASLEIEVMKMEQGSNIPKSVFNYKIPSHNLREAIRSLPNG